SERLELLAQRFLALVALLVGGLALPVRSRLFLRQPVDLPREALTFGNLGGQEGGEAAGRGPGWIDYRLEQLRCTRIVAQRRRQACQQRREAQSVEGAGVAHESLLRRGQARLLVRRGRPSEVGALPDYAVDLVGRRLQNRRQVGAC